MLPVGPIGAGLRTDTHRPVRGRQSSRSSLRGSTSLQAGDLGIVTLLERHTSLIDSTQLTTQTIQVSSLSLSQDSVTTRLDNRDDLVHAPLKSGTGSQVGTQLRTQLLDQRIHQGNAS
jgi:hypothetical protein